MPEHFKQVQAVLGAVFNQNVAVRADDSDQIAFGCGQRICDGKRVIDPGIEIENHFIFCQRKSLL